MVAVGALLIAPHTVSGAETMGTSGSHVRSNSAAILALIQQATEGSTTFRHLLEVIDANDAIVYVQEGRCGHGVRACFSNVTSSAGHRSLWVRVDTTKNVDWNLMGSIGHELRHTIEVLDEPSVVNGAAMFCLYQQIGYHGTATSMETRAAVEAGNAVREEVRAFNRQTKTE
jgi:hypothetical protein